MGRITTPPRRPWPGWWWGTPARLPAAGPPASPQPRVLRGRDRDGPARQPRPPPAPPETPPDHPQAPARCARNTGGTTPASSPRSTSRTARPWRSPRLTPPKPTPPAGELVATPPRPRPRRRHQRAGGLEAAVEAELAAGKTAAHAEPQPQPRGQRVGRQRDGRYHVPFEHPTGRAPPRPRDPPGTGQPGSRRTLPVELPGPVVQQPHGRPRPRRHLCPGRGGSPDRPLHCQRRRPSRQPGVHASATSRAVHDPAPTVATAPTTAVPPLPGACR